MCPNIQGALIKQKSFEHLYSVLAGCSTKESELLTSQSLTRMQRVQTLLDSFDSKREQTLFERFKQNGTWQCPTLTVLHSLANLDQPAFRKDSRLSYLPSWITASWDPSKDFRLKALTAEDYSAMRLRFDKELHLVGDMSKIGVSILAGTDTPNPYVIPGFGLHDELAFLVSAGLSPLKALQTATINPARYFGVEKLMGSVQVGKIADLVLLDANPLIDIHNTTRIDEVFVRGRALDRTLLDQMLKTKPKATSETDFPAWGIDIDN